MNNNDLINGSFELLSGVFSTINIFRLIKDKEVKGISFIPILFFTLWGIWNLYFYSNLGLTLSFIGGICITVVNTIWLMLYTYYRKR